MSSPHNSFTDWEVEVDQAAAAVDVKKEEAKWEKISIYHVPNFIKSDKETAFVPHVVSFGPFHHDSKNLTVSKEQKHIALCHFLHRSGKPLRLFADKLRSVLDQLLESYDGLDEKWKENPDTFLKLMLLDGCFMIEVLRLTEGQNGYASNDPVFGLKLLSSRIPYIKRDMLLLENQLPLLVLNLLLEVENRGRTDNQYINNLVLKFCGRDPKDGQKELGRHPLEVYRMSLLQSWGSFKRSRSGMERALKRIQLVQQCLLPFKGKSAIDPRQHIKPATAFHECGVDFVANEESMMGIDFNSKNGKLSLPVLTIHDGTEHQFLNMVVYEHMHVGVGKDITSFVAFMNELIDSAADVRLLQHKGIIKNELGSHKSIAKLFNTLAKDATPDLTNQHIINARYKLNEHIINARYELNDYCKKNRNKWFANLKHTHFESPWATISLVAAILVILLTLIQTFYSVLQYHHPPSSPPGSSAKQQ